MAAFSFCTRTCCFSWRCAHAAPGSAASASAWRAASCVAQAAHCCSAFIVGRGKKGIKLLMQVGARTWWCTICDAERVACWRCATSVKSTVLLTHGQCPVPTDIALQPLVLQQHTPDVPAADLWRSDARPPAHRALRRRTAQHVGAAAMARPTRCNTSLEVGGEHHTARCRPSAMDASDVARPTTSIWYVTACCQSLSSDRCVNMNSRAQRPRAWQTFHI